MATLPDPLPDHELSVLRDYIETEPLLDMMTACRTFCERLRFLDADLQAARVESAARRACNEVSMEIRRAVRWSARRGG